MMCRLLEISKQAYYDWRRPGRKDGREVKDRDVLKQGVYDQWEASEQRMGAWSIWQKMTKAGKKISQWMVRKLMHELGICGIQRQKKVTTTIQDPTAPARSDLIRRNFTSPVPTIKLAGDITYLKLNAKTTLYLAVVIDLCTRMVVGWELADNMKANLVVNALKNAWRNGLVALGAIFHSDAGSQYTSKLFKDFADTISVRLSRGRKATCFDNAVSESFFATLKKEWFYREKFASEEELRASLARYIEIYYNRQRPHSTLGGNTPVEEFDMHMNPRFDTMDKAA
jgi:transposase InsO family protein